MYDTVYKWDTAPLTNDVFFVTISQLFSMVIYFVLHLMRWKELLQSYFLILLCGHSDNKSKRTRPMKTEVGN